VIEESDSQLEKHDEQRILREQGMVIFDALEKL
jgi:hypothetical protein